MTASTAIPVQRRVWELVMSPDDDIAYQKSINDIALELSKEVSAKANEAAQLRVDINLLSSKEAQLVEQLDKVKDGAYKSLRFSVLRTVRRTASSPELLKAQQAESRNLSKQLDDVRGQIHLNQQELTYTLKGQKRLQKELQSVTQRIEDMKLSPTFDVPAYSGLLIAG